MTGRRIFLVIGGLVILVVDALATAAILVGHSTPSGKLGGLAALVGFSAAVFGAIYAMSMMEWC